MSKRDSHTNTHESLLATGLGRIFARILRSGSSRMRENSGSVGQS